MIVSRNCVNFCPRPNGVYRRASFRIRNLALSAVTSKQAVFRPHRHERTAL